MNLYFIRHGETEDNKAGVIQGQIDSDLTELGKKQAKQAIENLKDLDLDIIYCSDLGRTKNTAKIVNTELNLDIIFDQRLRERNFGIYEGKHRDLFDFNDFFMGNSGNPEFSTVEKDNQIKERILDFLKDLKDSDHKNILIVTHGGVIVQTKLLENKDWQFEKIKNCEIFSTTLEKLLK